MPGPKEIERYLQQQSPTLLRSLPAEQRQELVQLVGKMVQVQWKAYSGPLPEPEDLDKFNQIIPNGADRIMRMAEKQSEHRMALERLVVQGQQSQSKAGQWLGFATTVLLTVAGFWIALQGNTAVASVIFGTTILGLASVFIAGKFMQKRDLDQKHP